jgi:hypothetical protein
MVCLLGMTRRLHRAHTSPPQAFDQRRKLCCREADGSILDPGPTESTPLQPFRKETEIRAVHQLDSVRSLRPKHQHRAREWIVLQLFLHQCREAVDGEPSQRSGRALLLAERASHAADLARARDQNECLRQIIREPQRARFRRRLEKLEPDQLNLALVEAEQAVAAGEAEEERRDACVKAAHAAQRRLSRGGLPP